MAGFAVTLEDSEFCGWTYLSPIDAKAVQLLWAYEGLEKAATPVILLDNTLASFWTQPIPARATQYGALLFDTKAACNVGDGSRIQLRLELVDSTGKSYSYTSPDLLVWGRHVDPGTSTGEPHQFRLTFPGLLVDASKAHRRILSDPIPEVLDNQNKGVAEIRSGGKQGIIVLPSGTFVSKRPT